MWLWFRLIPRLGQGLAGRQPPHDGGPSGGGRLPRLPVLPARIGPVRHAAAVDGLRADRHRERGLGGGVEAGGYFAELKLNVRHNFSLLKRQGRQGQDVVVGTEQIAGQHQVVVVVRLVQHPVIQPCGVDACGDGVPGGNVVGQLVMPEEVGQRHVGRVAHCEAVDHPVPRQHFLISRLGDDDAQLECIQINLQQGGFYDVRK